MCPQPDVLDNLAGRPTWGDFNSLETFDGTDLERCVTSGRTRLLDPSLPVPILCAVLRYVLRSDDITRRQARWVGDAVEALGCP
jgi:hypothetical protein